MTSLWSIPTKGVPSLYKRSECWRFYWMCTEILIQYLIKIFNPKKPMSAFSTMGFRYSVHKISIHWYKFVETRLKNTRSIMHFILQDWKLVNSGWGSLQSFGACYKGAQSLLNCCFYTNQNNRRSGATMLSLLPAYTLLPTENSYALE